MIKIREVMRRSDQGQTRPFICRGDDDEIYFVKGPGAGYRSLLCEWVAGRLAVAFGLPVAEFVIVDVPRAFADFDDYADLGVGPAFASRALPHVQELTLSHMSRIDLHLRRDVLVFDWWVRNQDRMLSEHGGNPNLFWDEESSSLAVIDHNVAFDEDFNAPVFLELHAFAHHWQGVANDLAEQAKYSTRCTELLEEFDKACASAPDEWWEIDDAVPTNFDKQAIRSMLERCDNADFWRVSA